MDHSTHVTQGQLVFVVIIGVILVLSVIGNILVLVVMMKTPKLSNPTNLLICNMIVSDIILEGVVIPQNIHDVTHASNDYFEGDFLCRVVNFSPLLCIMASIYSMVAISFERKRAIVAMNEGRTTLSQVVQIIPLIWFLSLLFSIPTIYEYSEFKEPYVNGTSITRCGSHGVSRTYSTFNGVGILLLAYVVPLVLLLANYSSVLLYFRSKGLFGAKLGDTVLTQALYRGHVNVVKMLILIAVLFAISWMPYFTLLIIEKTTGQSDVTDSDSAIFMLRLALTVFSTAYNFLLNIIFNRNFRRGFEALFTCRHLVVRKNAVHPMGAAAATYAERGSREGQNTTSLFTLSLKPRSAIVK